MNISQLTEIENQIKETINKLKEIINLSDKALAKKNKIFNALCIIFSWLIGVSSVFGMPLLITLTAFMTIFLGQIFYNIKTEADYKLIKEKNQNELDLYNNQLDAIYNLKQYIKGKTLTKEELTIISKYITPLLPKNEVNEMNEKVKQEHEFSLEEEYIIKLEQLKSLFIYFDDPKSILFTEHKYLIISLENYAKEKHSDEDLRQKINVIDEDIIKYQQYLDSKEKSSTRNRRLNHD